MGAHDLFVAHKALVEQVAHRVCARHHIYGDEREDFIQELWLHLLKNDCAAIRKHRGESTLGTFLTTVVANFARDFREKKWGKWRVSAAAKAQGPTAEQLDTLLSRDGLTMDEACEVLATRGVIATRTEFEEMAATFPTRGRPREVQPDEDGPEPAAVARTDEAMMREDDRRAAARVQAVLKEVVDGLPARDRLIIKLRFYDGLSQVTIARMLGIEQKLFFRLGDKLARDLRLALEARGLTRAEILTVLGSGGLALVEDVHA